MKPMFAARQSASLRSLRSVVSTSSMMIRPESGWSIAAIRLSSVDLPDPDGPIKPRNSPRAMSKRTSLSTGTSCPPRRYDLQTSQILTRGAAATSHNRVAAFICALRIAACMPSILVGLHTRPVGDSIEGLQHHFIADVDAAHFYGFADAPSGLHGRALRA